MSESGSIENPPGDFTALRLFILQRFAKRGTTSIDDRASLVKSGLVDSFGIVEIVSYIESEYHVRIADADVAPEHFENLNAIRALLARSPKY
ncbi:MAG: acyl carrier protein [Planctomycetes bacterium]|nr:acyl carrier protein [Planctomycetota bacterium]